MALRVGAPYRGSRRHRNIYRNLIQADHEQKIAASGVGGQKDEVRVGREVVDSYIAGNSDAAAPPPSSASQQPLSHDTAHFSYRPSYIPTFHFRLYYSPSWYDHWSLNVNSSDLQVSVT